MTDRPRTELNKDDVLEGLFASWDTIDALLAGLTPEQWQTPTGLPGWTVHDVVAHMVGTEAMLAGDPLPESGGERPAHVRNDIGALNERWVEHLRAEPPESMLAKFREVTDRRRKTLTALGPAEWSALTPTPVGPDTYGRFMRVRTFDCWFHEHDIRDAVGEPAGEAGYGGADARLALDEMESSMGFVVAKKGGAPDGSRVEMTLTGPLARTIRVAIDGRAAVVPDFGDREPTATIALDGRQFVRLAGGRPTHDEIPQGVEYRGDEAVGTRIVENLNYLI